MKPKRTAVKRVYHAHNIDGLAAALIDLIGFFSSPKRVELLLREAEVHLDRALFPLLVCLAMRGPLSVAGLSDQIGRDHTTISRQLSKLESLDLIYTQGAGVDRRVRTVNLSSAGEKIVQAITTARRRLLSRALADWTESDLATLALLNRRFVDGLAAAARVRALTD